MQGRRNHEHHLCHMIKDSARTIRVSGMLVLLLAVSGVAVAGPIHDAARKGNRAAVIALLKQNPGLVSSKDSLGNTPLHLAAHYDQPEIVALLLANGADVNAQAETGWSTKADGGEMYYGKTPLTAALLSYHHKRVVELLVTRGADVNLDSGGSAPLTIAIALNLPDDVKLLLANGANPDSPIYDGGTAVHMAVRRGRLEILKLLLDYGANPNAKDAYGHTPMHSIVGAPNSGRYQESTTPGYDNKMVALLAAHGGHK